MVYIMDLYESLYFLEKLSFFLYTIVDSLR